MLTRRHFLAGSAVIATKLFGAPKESSTPSPELEKLGAVALREAKKYKATYCDIRIVRLRDQRIWLAPLAERGTGKTLSVPNVAEDSSFGFGVRVIVNGAWGFASSPIVTQEEIAASPSEAVIIAKANASIQPKPVQLAPVKAYRDRWVTPHDKDPFDVPMAEKLDLLRRVSGGGQEEPESLRRLRQPQPAQRGQVFRVHRRLLHPAVHPADLRQRGRHGGGSREQAFRAAAATSPRRLRPAGNTCRR